MARHQGEAIEYIYIYTYIYIYIYEVYEEGVNFASHFASKGKVQDFLRIYKILGSFYLIFTEFASA